MSIGIYKITNPNNKIYIGQSIDIESRWNYYCKLYCKTQTKLYNSLKKYGPENHKFEIIEECSEDNLIEKETYWKKYYNVMEIPSLCCRIDGKSGHLSDEIKLKISNSLKGNKKTEYTKQKIKNNIPNKKRVHQYNLEGKLVNIWDSIQEAQRNNKGNIKRNILGKTKHAGNFIWLREEDKLLITERLEVLKKYINPNKNKKRSAYTCKLLSENIQGKKKKYKQEYLFKNIEFIREENKSLSIKQLAVKYKVSFPTMYNFINNNIR